MPMLNIFSRSSTIKRKEIFQPFNSLDVYIDLTKMRKFDIQTVVPKEYSFPFKRIQETFNSDLCVFVVIIVQSWNRIAIARICGKHGRSSFQHHRLRFSRFQTRRASQAFKGNHFTRLSRIGMNKRLRPAIAYKALVV